MPAGPTGEPPEPDVGPVDGAGVPPSGLATEEVAGIPGYQVTGRYRAGGVGDVGGDWYDVLQVPGGAVVVVIGDVAGHGVTAATTMEQLRQAARAYLLEGQSAAAVLSRLNDLVHSALPDQVATAAIVGLPAVGGIDVLTASAGHLPPVVVVGGVVEFAPVPAGPALGVAPDVDYTETTQQLDLDLLLLYTDGLVERRGEPIDAGLARLAEACARHLGSPDFVDAVIADVSPMPAEDDLAVLLVGKAG